MLAVDFERPSNFAEEHRLDPLKNLGSDTTSKNSLEVRAYILVDVIIDLILGGLNETTLLHEIFGSCPIVKRACAAGQ